MQTSRHGLHISIQIWLAVGSIALLVSGPAWGQNRSRDTSPVRGIDGRQDRRPAPTAPTEIPSLDGSGHNLTDLEMNAADTQLLRIAPSDYTDGISTLAGEDRPDPRTISNLVVDQPDSLPNDLGLTDFIWQWGQFVDHDIDLSDGTDPPESADIPIPAGDVWFDPTGLGTVVLSFNRTVYDTETGLSTPREQKNQITGWIDASNVYGSDTVRALALRANDGSGRLATSTGDLLPFNVDGFANAGGSDATLFLAGDVRANEQVGLTAMHTLFVREHNRLAEGIARDVPGLSGDEIYDRARLMVMAEMQVITYQEFLPALLGAPLPAYQGYDSTVDGRISNLFSTAAYRFGHSALSPTLLRLDAQGQEIADGHLALRDAFFAPTRITDEGGIEPVLRGLASQTCQSVDAYVIDDVRNFLFGPPGSGGFDLVALNLQRGRDHGLPSYVEARAAVGLERPETFAEITSDLELQARLEQAYGEVEAIDVWVGGLAEDPLPGAMVGELIAEVLRDQFAALRDGDRFWYANVLDARQQVEAERTRLADVIRRNTSIGPELQADVFRSSTGSGGNGPTPDRPRGGRRQR